MGKLQAGDAVQAVNGRRIATVDQFTSFLKHANPASRSRSTFDAKRAAGVAHITLGSHPGRDYGFAGVSVMDAPWAPFVVDFDLANVGGPSAGLMFSLAVVDKVATGNLAGTKFVAGTGTIKVDGTVGRIGGIVPR